MPNENTIQTDVLIIGGGVQGLWLLGELIGQGYATVLLESRLLGSQQTCHSHVYIHRGHVYSTERLNTDDSLVERLQKSCGLWDSWLDGRDVIRGYEPSIFGFENRSKLQLQAGLWNELGLTYQKVSTPAILKGGAISDVCKTSEKILDGQSLVYELSRPYEGCIGQIQHIDQIKVQPDGLHGSPNSRIVVEAIPQRMNAEESFDGANTKLFSSSAVFLTAGAGIGDLLRLATDCRGKTFVDLKTTPQIRKAHMLVVRGSFENLPALTGVFPDVGGLFIVSRQPKTRPFG